MGQAWRELVGRGPPCGRHASGAPQCAGGVRVPGGGESGVPIPVPGDFLMLKLGVRARDGALVLWQVNVAMEGGTVLGSSLLYLLAGRAGRGLVGALWSVYRHCPAQLDRAEAQLKRRGAMAVVLGRLLPGLRVVTAVACGVFRVPYR